MKLQNTSTKSAHDERAFIRGSVCGSMRACVRKLGQISTVISQNVTNKSCFACIKSEKYAFLVTLTPQ